MVHFYSRRRKKNRPRRAIQNAEVIDRASPDSTGSEAAHLKSLVDSHAKVTVVLKTGEKLHGRIRYYDRDCFSIGPAAAGPKIFLRKSSVSYIAEE